MDPKLYEQILEKLKNMGLDTGKLQLTPQVDETS
jgi:hypothetical protein